MNRILFRVAPLSLVLVAACAASPAPPASTAQPALVTSGEIESVRAEGPATESTPVLCDLVCEQARVVRRDADDPDYHAQATANANQVLTALQPQLLACYQKRVAVAPNAHGFVTMDIVIGSEGRVVDVETTGGAILGKATMSCMTQRIRNAVFAPPHGGGTLRIQVPFSLRRIAAGEEA